MTDNTSAGLEAARPLEVPAMPVRLVRGSASLEELSAVIAVVAVLAAADSNDEPDQSHSPAPGHTRSARSPWSEPARMVRGAHSHGPGGWRASVSPR